MLKSNFIFENHPILILVCILIATGFAYLMYRKTNTWKPKVKWVLTATRFLGTFFICLLLVVPILKQIKNYFEKPITVFLIDNSSSIKSAIDNVRLNHMISDIIVSREKLEREGQEIEIRSLSANNVIPSNLLFDQNRTNLDEALKNIEGDYENRNLSSVVLFSDGIYNTGISPSYRNYNLKINTIGVGDTTQRKDLVIKDLDYNKIAYQGNQFPLRATILNKGYGGSEVYISVYNGGKLVVKKEHTLNSDKNIEIIELLLEAVDAGMQSYRVEVSRQKDEQSFENNIARAYIDIIDGKEKILMIAAAPHPDIKTIRNAIETKSTYEFELFIPGIDEEPTEKYDLVIYHQFADRRNSIMPWFDKFNREEIPYWVIASGTSNYNILNDKIPFVSIQLLGSEGDDITASVNKNFSHFSISDESINLLEIAPPIQVPFSKITTNAQVLLYQKLGSVTTRNPLLIVSDLSNQKAALMMSGGFWKWGLFEYAQYEKQTALNELITKLVQFLSTKQDKRKFKCYPNNKEMNINESLVFETEVYNDLYEPIYDKTIDIEILDSSGKTSKYNYTTSSTNTQFIVRGLEEGVYAYTATTQLNEKKEQISGKFLVKTQNFEDLSLTANFSLLKTLASSTQGRFYEMGEIDEMTSAIINEKSPNIIHSEEAYMPIINMPWVFVLILLLFSVEWFYRKYSGHY